MISKTIKRNAYAFGPYLELTKPRILAMVLVSSTIGYYLGSNGTLFSPLFLWTLLGTALTSGGAGVLNHYLERHTDALMARTRNRPLPSGQLQPNQALLFGLILILGGISILLWGVNVLTAFLGLLSAFIYILIYTPMKKITWLNTTIGAIPGALPIMGGWTAATNRIELEAWILFAILFLWQHPHFYSIDWMFKAEYHSAGFKMLSGIKNSEKWTPVLIIVFLIALIPVSALPAIVGFSGGLYFAGVVLLGIGFLASTRSFIKAKTAPAARTILKASVLYLPLVLILIVIDQVL
ncbi:MAG: heme o synthase [Fidelibacterota bacterium]